MRRLLQASVFAALPLLALGPTAALAVSPSEEACIASGGTFDRVQGEVICAEPVGNAQSENAQTVEQTGQGNLGNKEACAGPGSGSSEAQCP